MRLTAYLGAMGMVVLHYDTFLTLKDEVRLLFSHSPIPLTPSFRRCASFGQEVFLSQKSSTTSIDISPSLL